MKLKGGLSDYDRSWIEASAAWKKANPPDFAGYWYCVIGGGALTDGRQDAMGGFTLNLGHDISRTRNRTKRLDMANIAAECPYHNREQGSRSFDEYRATNPRKSCGW